MREELENSNAFILECDEEIVKSRRVDINDDLVVLIDSLIQRQITLQEVILERLDNAFYTQKTLSQTKS